MVVQEVLEEAMACQEVPVASVVVDLVVLELAVVAVLGEA